MRLRGIAVVAVALAAVLAGCTGKQAPTVPSAGGPATATQPPGAQAQELAFVACMRDKGIADMPDPVPGDTSGHSAVRYAIDVMGKGSDENFQAALDQCMNLLPAPEPTKPPSAGEIEAWRLFAQCMRDHGVGDFPDPTGGGPDMWFSMSDAADPAVTVLDGGQVLVNLGIPTVSAAFDACQADIPRDGTTQ
ncbi:MAG TPA: hypothetical protein VH561_03870 [Micromonosporaceae bacterium]|jgi:hypothetical protein